MNALDRPTVTSTARRRHRARVRPLEVAVVTIGVAASFVVLVHHRPETPAPVATSQPARTPTARPSPSPLVTPLPPPMVEEHGPWVVAVAPTSPPSPAPPVAAATPRRFRPTATPRVSQCLAVRWSAGQSAAAWGQVLVAIDIVNRCGRILEPIEMHFRIAGYRHGALVQTAQGTAFQRLYPDRSESVMIGLPGSIDWYDRITVEVVD